MFRTIGMIAISMLTLSACIGSPESFESTPVEIATKEGKVTCQLYTKETVLWDRSLDRPAGMSVTAADQYCKVEGEREKNTLQK